MLLWKKIACRNRQFHRHTLTAFSLSAIIYSNEQLKAGELTQKQQDGKRKYAVLADDIKNAILEGRVTAGDKIASENVLARQYEISRHTVRKALSILEEEGFVEAIHGVGTFCTKKAKPRGNSNNIAVITTYISDYIFPRLIQGIDKVLTENGYSIILKNTANSRANERKCLEDMLTKDIDGLIIEPSKSQILCKHIELYEQLDALGIPYIFIQGCHIQMRSKPHILMDDEQGVYLLTKHLIQTGHKQIAGIFKADDSQGRERHKGYVRALTEAGFAYNPDLVIQFHTEDRKRKPAQMVTLMLEDQDVIDAIVCYNDQIAMEVYRVLETLGRRVPEDISITGYDNSNGGDNSILQLTTIAHPQEKLGEMAAELILEQIRGVPLEESKVKKVIEPNLIVGNSCKER